MPKYFENYKISYSRLLIQKEVVEVLWKLGVSESGNVTNLFLNKLLPPRTKSQTINTPCLLLKGNFLEDLPPDFQHILLCLFKLTFTI